MKKFKGRQRGKQLEDGFFDGRFMEKSVTPKKKKDTVKKHKKKIWEDLQDEEI